MRKGTGAGFTIIETTLYLAISGMMILGLLIGITGALDRQRYRDSVNSLAAFLSGEYDRVTNTQNDNNDSIKGECAEGDVRLNTGAFTVARGTTDCTVIGRYISSGTNPSGEPVLFVGNIYGTQEVEADGAGVSDIDAILASQPVANNLFNEQSYALEWTMRVVKAGAPEAIKQFEIFLIRSPIGGGVNTFVVQDHVPIVTDDSRTLQARKAELADIIKNAESRRGILKLCVNDNLGQVRNRSGVSVAAGAGASASVKVLESGQC